VTILIAVSLNVAGSILRTISVFVADGHSSSGYVFLLAGQALCALAQPFVCNTPAKVAGDWFPAEEQNVAVTIASLINPLGNALGQVVPSLLVACSRRSTHSHHVYSKCPKEHIQGFFTLLASQAVITAVMATWAWCSFQSEPPSPPSEAALHRRRLRQAAERLPGGQGVSPGEEMWELTKTMLANRQFLILGAGFGIGLGLFSAFVTLFSPYFNHV